MNNIIKSIQDLKITLPEAAKPVANYSPYVLCENIIYVSGQIPFKDGIILYKGKVGKDININEAIAASEICLINTLAVLNLATNNNLNRVKSCIKINVFINSTEDFFDQPLVADGASNLIKKIFKENGNHARSAVSCNSLPKNASVEIDSLFQLVD
tara:strand:- start:99 stop:566 length:468 start_codon:yes stop_codon:yes gene_type:complete